MLVRKFPFLLLMIVLTACSSFPYQFVWVNNTPGPDQIETLEGNCPGTSCQETVIPSPNVFPTPTLTLKVTQTIVPSLPATATQEPTKTISPTETATPTQTITPTPTVPSFIIQPGTPVYLQNFAHPEEGCNWMGAAGQVFDRSGNPIANMVVVIEGILNDASVDLIGMTGLESAYGPGGFEMVFGNLPVN